VLVIWSMKKGAGHAEELQIFKTDKKRYHATLSIPQLEPGDVLLSMGGVPLKEIQQAGFLPKGRTITSMREKLHPIGDGHCFITFDRDMKEFDHTSYVKMQTDIGLVKRYLDTGSVEPQLGSYVLDDDFHYVPAILNDMFNKAGCKPVRVALDLETVSLNPFDSKAFIVSVSISYEEGHSELIRFKGVEDQPDGDSGIWDQINWLLNDDRISLVGANLKYDLLWIRLKWGIECTNFKMDTTLVGSLLDENRSNSLNTHCKIYAPTLGGYDDTFNATQDKSRMDLVSDADLIPYAGGDTDATLRVANKMVKLLTQSKSQTRFYTHLLHPASRAFEDMEYNGILMDVPYYAELQVELFKEMDMLTAQARAMMPNRILNKYADDFALSKSGIIKEFMFTHSEGLKLKPLLLTEKTKEPSTAFNHLKMFEFNPKASNFVKVLKEWTSAKKTESTYVTGFLKHLREDGRLHPTAILYRGDYGGNNDDAGTVTGRTSFKDPAFQTEPKHTKWAKKLRKGFPAPEGYAVVSWDYSQGELRVMACMSNCGGMINAYKQGFDLHLKTGAELNGYTLKEAMAMKDAKDPLIKAIRQGGKAGNFGLIYDITPEGFVIYARDTYGVVLTLNEAEAQQDQFFGMYPEIREYHAEARAHAHKHESVQSPLGRVRHLPMINSTNFGKRMQAERQAINSPVQSTLSDLAQLALSLYREKYGNHEDCQFFAMTHDSLTAYVRLTELDFWVPEIQGIMANLPLVKFFDWHPQLQFIVDSEVGPNMGEMIELVEFPGASASLVYESHFVGHKKDA